MKILILSAILGLMPVFGQTEPPSSDVLAEAKALFPKFQASLFKDERKADDAFEPFLEMPKTIQAKLLKWIDQQYDKEKKAFRAAQTGSGLSSSRAFTRGSEKVDTKGLQKEMERIRSLSDENKMKQELQSSGWSNLEKLLVASKRSSGSKKVSLPDPRKVAAAKARFEMIAGYRYQLRSKMYLSVEKVSDELRKLTVDNSEEVEEIEYSRKNQSVLDANEKFKDEITKAEYDGILEVNHWRIACGLDPLKIDPKLCLASRDHCKDMATKGFFAHMSPVKGKRTPSDRARNFGTSGGGENIAINSSVSEANKAWFYSPGHHKNLFSPRYTAMGLGIHGRHFTQMFR